MLRLAMTWNIDATKSYVNNFRNSTTLTCSKWKTDTLFDSIRLRTKLQYVRLCVVRVAGRTRYSNVCSAVNNRKHSADWKSWAPSNNNTYKACVYFACDSKAYRSHAQATAHHPFIYCTFIHYGTNKIRATTPQIIGCLVEDLVSLSVTTDITTRQLNSNSNSSVGVGGGQVVECFCSWESSFVFAFAFAQRHGETAAS